MKYVRKTFNDLDPDDYFGFISLDQASKDEIILEKVKSHKFVKNRLLKDVSEREIEYVFSHYDRVGAQAKNNNQAARTVRLELALEKAYQWQYS